MRKKSGEIENAMRYKDWFSKFLTVEIRHANLGNG